MPYHDFPSIESVSVRASAGVSFYVVIAMAPRFEVADVPGWEDYEVPELDDWR